MDAPRFPTQGCAFRVTADRVSRRCTGGGSDRDIRVVSFDPGVCWGRSGEAGPAPFVHMVRRRSYGAPPLLRRTSWAVRPAARERRAYRPSIGARHTGFPAPGATV